MPKRVDLSYRIFMDINVISGQTGLFLFRLARGQSYRDSLAVSGLSLSAGKRILL